MSQVIITDASTGSKMIVEKKYNLPLYDIGDMIKTSTHQIVEVAEIHMNAMLVGGKIEYDTWYMGSRNEVIDEADVLGLV